MNGIAFNPAQQNYGLSIAQNRPAFGNRLKTAVYWEGAKAGGAFLTHKVTDVDFETAYMLSKGAGDILETAYRRLLYIVAESLYKKHTGKIIDPTKADYLQKRLYTHNPLNLAGWFARAVNLK